MSETPVEQMKYEKAFEDGTVVSCTIEIFDDGSVYVVGSEFGELIFEFAPDNVQNAVSYLEAAGYTKCDTGS